MGKLNQQDPWLPQSLTLNGKQQELDDTVTLNLDNTKAKLSFLPGQFMMLYAFGQGEIPVSISGDPTHSNQLVHTIRKVGAVSNALATLMPGESIGVRGPFGSYWPLEQAQDKHLMLVAGGLGLAPLRSVIYHALAKREQFRSVQVFYGSRNPQSLLYLAELQQWQQQIPVNLTVDHATAQWHGPVGVITEILPAQLPEPEHTLVMTCGPEIMMRFCANYFVDAGVSPQQIYLSMERNMKCALGFCGRCQFGPHFMCKNGPVFNYQHIAPWLMVREL